MIKGIIFDFDGVIINSEPLHYEVEKEIFQELGMDVTFQEYEMYAGISEKETYDFLKEKYQVSFDNQAVLQDKISRFVQKVEDGMELPLVEGIEKVVKNLNQEGFMMAVGTSGTREICEAVLKQAGLRTYFQWIVSGNDVVKAKPEPEIFNKVVDLSGRTRHEWVVLEDSHNGIKAARAAGIKVVGFKNQSSGDQDLNLADQVITHLNQFNRKLIEKL
ncbi:MAG: HAD family hydrolase [Candidatus Cyclobacteriaceae bacterium M3_2C_046]